MVSAVLKFPNCEMFEYKPLSTNKKGGKAVYVCTVPGSTSPADRIRFQMSESGHHNLQTVVWGLSTPMSGQDNSRRTLELTIESPELLAFLEKLDAKNIETAFEKAREWFPLQSGAPLTLEDVQNMYVPLVKPPYKEGGRPTVRTKVKVGDSYPTKIFAAKGAAESLVYAKGTAEHLTRNSKCLTVVETTGLWFMSRQFGMSLNVTEILVWSDRRRGGIDAFSFSERAKWSEDGKSVADSEHRN